MGERMSDTVTLTKALARRVELLSVAMQRTPQAILKSALERGLDYEEWFLQQVDAGIAEADRGELIDHGQVEDNLNKLRKRIGKNRRKAA